jgi:protein ImuB
MRLACFYIPMFPLAARLRSEPDLLSEALAIVEGNGSSAHVVAATRRARIKGVKRGLSLAQARSIFPKLIARGRDGECERTAQEALLDVAESFSPRIEDAGSGVVYLDVTGMERHYALELEEERVILSRRSAAKDPEVESAEERPHPAGPVVDARRRPAPPPDESFAAPPLLPGFNSGVLRRASPAQDDTQPHEAQTREWQLRLAQAAIRAADAVGLPIRVGIAGSKLAARVAAELPSSPTIVPEGDEARFLAPLPLTRLAPEIEAAAMLQRWGIESIGQLARLPESDVATRLGEIGRALHWAARGIDPTPLNPRQLPPEFREGMELEWPLVALEPFLYIASAALDRLAARLEIQGFACRRLELTMNLEPDGWHSRAIDLPAPTRDVKTMLTLLRLDLERTPPGAPVAAFSIVAHPDRPRRAQLSLFGPAALSPDKLATTIARLAAMLGEDRIGMAMTVDGHLPERYALGAYDPPPPPDLKCGPQKSRGLLAVRVLRPPIPVEVTTEETAEGTIRITYVKTKERGPSERPHPAGPVVDTRRRPAPPPGASSLKPDPVRPTLGAPPLEINGPVRTCAGPWRVEEAWWANVPIGRQYWDVELEGGGGYRMFQVRRGEWIVDATYD